MVPVGPGPRVVAPSERVVVALGANLGDARGHLLAGLQGLVALQGQTGHRLLAVSPLYRSAPWETTGPDFLNAVVLMEGPCHESAPLTLLKALWAIEQQQGRERPFRYAPRTLDLDLILYGSRVIDTPDLQVPHPRALQRAFVLQPMKDVQPGILWPGLGLQWQEYLADCAGPLPERLHDPLWPEGPLAS